MKKIFVILALFLGFFINTNAQKKCDPELPQNWEVIINSPMGDDTEFSKLKFNIDLVKEGTNLSANFKKEAETGVSACYLDFLLNNKKAIPDEWKGKRIIFSGTVFKDSSGNNLYKVLVYKQDGWDWEKNYWDYINDNTYRLIK